ncbi:hypothetical protein SYYSPA8_16225 [Streptomyces yaizuensis]|uniref:Uncharacterized protein n=1 Tax=Streptomyces yaizuensis TaxID=2989713 RepID=A0ABQ5NZS6_9ACTN|nr:hypothetical protein SYYSPA8_16225 [Streptomyces sp. YSPA8]
MRRRPRRRVHEPLAGAVSTLMACALSLGLLTWGLSDAL